MMVLFADVVHFDGHCGRAGHGAVARGRDGAGGAPRRWCAATAGAWKSTGDGVMAIFGARGVLGSAVRACLAAVGVQEEAKRLAVEARERRRCGPGGCAWDLTPVG